jgi:hypothetical protein
MSATQEATMASDYEAKALQEVEAYFRAPEDGLLGRVSKTLFKPVETLSERLVPDKILEIAGNGVEAVLRGIASVADQTINVDGILASARERAIEVDRIEDLGGKPLRDLDELAAEVASQHGVLAALEGAGCGMGGAALLAADIPLLLGTSLRVVRQISVCYGVDPFAPGEGVVAFKVFELACGGTRDRYAQLLEIDALRDELDGLEPQKRAEKAAVLASLIATREMARTVVSLLFKVKIFQTIPLAGVAVGAGFNYAFVSGVAEAATNVYRRRTLQERQEAPEGKDEQ